MKLKLFTLTLMMALLTSSFTYTVFAEETSPDPIVEGEEPVEGGDDLNETEGLDDINGNAVDPSVLEGLRNQTLNMYQELLGYFGNATQAPAVSENFQHAQDAIEEGDSKNNTRAAAQMYLRAMKQFRNALRKYLHDNPDALQDFEPGNATEPEPDLNATTSEEIEEARVQLIQRFQERFRERLSLMYDNLDNVTGSLSDGDAVKAQNTIRKAEGKLLRIQERISRGEYDEAIDDLENATDSMDEGFEGMEDAFAGQMLRTMNKLEARVQKLVEKHERKEARGEDTGELDDLIDELRGNIHRSRDEVRNGRGNGGHGQDNGEGKPDDKGKPDMGDKGKGGN
jgi:tetratricopeptide (TPR) repeat protein